MSNPIQSLTKAATPSLLVILVVTLTISFIPIYVNAQSSESTIPAGFSLFEDAKRGYTIIYPSDAQKGEAFEGTEFTNEREGWSFAVKGPFSLDGKNLKEFVEEIYDFSEFGFGSFAEDLKELEVNGSPAIMVDSSFDDQKGWNIFVQNGDDYYEIQVRAPIDSFSSHTDMFYTMLKSLTFTNR